VRIFAIMLALLLTLLGGCRKEEDQPPSPVALTPEVVGYYCGMNLSEHAGPKGQIILSSRNEPVWFSSVRDTLSFTMLPEEPKDIRAVYVSDMGKAMSWEDPGASNWINAHKAVFVIESRMKGGMGAPEAVPFADRSAAERFTAENGGQIVTFGDVPRDYILGTIETAPHKH